MSAIFSHEFSVRWSDLDPNWHMRHTSYADMCAATRFYFLEQKGFGFQKLQQIMMGPVLFSENIRYLKEIKPNDRVIVQLQIAGYTQDGRKWRMFHEILRAHDGQKVAELEINGAWFDIKERKVKAPPNELMKAIEDLPKSQNFQMLD